MPKHYVVQGGMFDTLPDETEVFVDRSAAVDAAARLFELNDLEKTRLELGMNFVYLDVVKHGADYVEIYTCECSDVTIHYQTAERRVTA